jgi:hypothetical protein
MKTKLPLLACLVLPLVGPGVSQTSAAVSVYGTASSTGPTISVRVHADITATPILSYGFRVLSDPGVVQGVDAVRNEAIWFLGSSLNPIPYPPADLSQPGEALLVGGRMDSANPLQGVLGNNVLLGMVVYGRVTTETPTFELAPGRPAEFADFVTKYGSVLDDQPGQVTYVRIRPDPNDMDLDGLLDTWEKDHFGSIEKAFYSDDPDNDEYNNRAEQELGSDPRDRDSNLGFIILPEAQGLSLRWTSFEGRLFTVEISQDLRRFRPLQTGIKATPPVNTFPLQPSTTPGSQFYRVLLESAGGP